MRTPLAILPMMIAIGLAGCGPPAPDQGSAPQPAARIAAPAAPAITPPATPSVDPLAIAAEGYAARETPLALMDGGEEPPVRYFDVIDCNEETRDADPKDARPHPDEVVARRVALLRRSLQLLGYRPDVIEAPLADYAASATRASSPEQERSGYARLAAALDAARAAKQPDRPAIRAEGGCGAAETPIIVRTQPAGGRVWLITRFAFDLCRGRGLDAWNRIACDRWTEVGPERAVQLSGNYAYQSEWAGGRRGRGARRIDPIADEADGDTPQVITVDGS